MVLKAPFEVCKEQTQTKARRYSIFTIDGIIWGSKVCRELKLEEKWDRTFTPMIQALQYDRSWDDNCLLSIKNINSPRQKAICLAIYCWRIRNIYKWRSTNEGDSTSFGEVMRDAHSSKWQEAMEDVMRQVPKLFWNIE